MAPPGDGFGYAMEAKPIFREEEDA